MKNKNKIHLFAVAFLFVSVLFVRIDGVSHVARAEDNCACEDGTYECECGDDGYTEEEYNDDYEDMDDETFCEMYPDECVDDTSDSAKTEYEKCIETNSARSFAWCCNNTNDAPAGVCPTNGDSCDGDWVNNECLEKCGSGYTRDSSGDCVPSDACPDGYSLVNGDCVDSSGKSSQCDYGYTWDGKDCIANDSCPDGSALVNGKCVDTSGNSVDSSCDPSSSCWFYNCCDSTDGTSSVSGQIVKINQAMVDSKGRAYPVGTSINTSTGVATLPDGSTVTLPSSDLDAVNSAISGDSSLTLCVDATYGQICTTTSGSDSPFVLVSGDDNGGGLPYPIVGGTTTAKCGVGFTPVGGVCFPTQTGLSNASVYSILAKIFSWLMMLFTTLAVGAFVISGIQYLMSAGDESLAETAKKNAINAVLGIIVGLSGFIIIRAIAAALSGSGYLF